MLSLKLIKYSLFIVLTLFFGSLFVLPAVLADTVNYPLPIYNDLREENRENRLEMIEKYNSREFYSCFTCAEISPDNPFAVRACLEEARYCLDGRTVPNVECRGGEAASAGRCVTLSEGCQEKFGENSYYLGGIKNNNFPCGCRNGYAWNNNKSRCVQTACPDGFIFYSSYRYFDGSFMHGRCMTRDNACRSEYGEFSRFNRLSEDGSFLCGCASGHDWNEFGTACSVEIIVKGITSADDEFIYLSTVDREIASTGNIDNNLRARLKGRILLQVEESGEAWYVNPDDLKRYFLSSPARAFAVMREFGLGATHDFLTTHTIYPERVRGKILIDVDDLGRAYYINPLNGLAYYLGSPLEAYGVMRELGLGISTGDIRKIEVGF